VYEGRTLVVILCMHRCGSSVTASVLQRLGMSLGPFPLLGASEYNKYGHFEALPFYELDRQLQEQVLGFAWDIPESPDVMRSLCEREGRWQSESCVSESMIEHGKELLRQLIESGPISGFKDPRVPLLWPFWRRVFSCFPGLRIVPLFLIRSPHEIAMSVFRRSKGAFTYQDALEVTAVHFKRMDSIRKSWEGDCALVRFDPAVYAQDLKRAVQICGLVWQDEVFAELYDPACKHHEAVVVTHAVQALFQNLGGLSTNGCCTENLARVERDAAVRESILRSEIQQHREEALRLRREIEQWRPQEVKEYRAEIESRRQEVEHYRREVEQCR
jgi:hypothetical protein